MASAHTVVAGDTLYTIAQQNGFPNWRTISDHASNTALRALRLNPHVLHPGDIVQIPEVPKRPGLEVPLDARTAPLQAQQLKRDLDVGRLNPLLVTTTDQGASGAKGRLRNIGFAVVDVDVDEPSQFDLAEALRRFQSEQQLATSGLLDAAPRDRLQQVHGS